MSIMGERFICNGDYWKIVILGDDICGIAIDNDPDPFIISVDVSSIEKILKEQNLQENNKVKIAREKIIDCIDRGMAEIKEVSPTIKNQEKFSTSQRKNVFEILLNAFQLPIGDELAPSDIVLWFLGCEIALEREMTKEYYPRGLAKPLARFAKKNLIELVGSDFWDACNPKLSQLSE